MLLQGRVTVPLQQVIAQRRMRDTFTLQASQSEGGGGGRGRGEAGWGPPTRPAHMRNSTHARRPPQDVPSGTLSMELEWLSYLGMY